MNWQVEYYKKMKEYESRLKPKLEAQFPGAYIFMPLLELNGPDSKYTEYWELMKECLGVVYRCNKKKEIKEI